MTDPLKGITLPWPYSTDGDGPRTTPNVPCEQGAALGKELARFASQAEAEVRPKYPDTPPMCNECAYRLGTVPNQCATTVMDALKCWIEKEPFHCHKGYVEGEEPKRICGGWAVLVSAKE